ncbi:hypothetical protein PMAYCL1PPCAC_00099 [Pristionchus mayeri]|uniref:Uncharacterized protein n=1 Tax=Pristionchus mayeri TaxID=1317129 RepID=A0AAN4YY76_9BILA|nr:hypothetical protein PMAYCL1PPCAC_00099 [Pristionchus mayeri]
MTPGPFMTFSKAGDRGPCAFMINVLSLYFSSAMGDSDDAFDGQSSENIGILSQVSRNELLDISSNSVIRTPVISMASINAPLVQHDEDTDPQLLISAEEEDNLQVVLAMNEAMSDLIDTMIEKAEQALRANREKQKILEERKKIFNTNAAMVKRKVPVTMFMPPYFKDQFNMCPPQNPEMKRKLECMIYDPLLKEEKKWSDIDLRTLHRAVRNSMIEGRLMSIYGQRDLLLDKIRDANATTTAEERADWNNKLDAFNRKIDFEKTLNDKDLLTGDYSKVDWATIAMVHFKGQRTPSSLRLKWCNEQCPQWNKSDWTAAEVKKLNELARNDFVSWTLIADKLGTRRTPWQCFEKYKSEISSEILKREWTQEEDDRLVKLVESLQLNRVIQWDKVTYHMAGRTRQQCRTRYLRTLDKSIKHGRWTDEEDLLLMCSIGRYGAKDWRKIAKGVPGRNDGQCRERWVNVLDRANRSEEWTMEEDEKLLYAVNMFGKGQWAKISTVLPGRNQRTCKARFRSLLTTKMRICAAQLSKIREAQASRKVISRGLKKRSDDTFREFNQLVGGNDETGKSFCDQARSVALADKYRFKRAEPEVRRVIEEGMLEISRKYQGRERRWSGMSDDGEQLFNGIEHSIGVAKKDQTWLPVEFDSEVSEYEKCQFLTEALCQVVDKQDQLRSVAAQEAYESRAKQEVADRLKRILVDAVESRVRTSLATTEIHRKPSISKDSAVDTSHRSLEAYVCHEMQSAAESAANDMLHPTAVTSHSAELLMAELPRIVQIATPLLSSLWSDEKLNSMDEVLVHMEEMLKSRKEYLKLGELMRCLLIEPLMLIFSVEDDDRKKAHLTEEFNRFRDRLMQDVQIGNIEVGDTIRKPRRETATKKASKDAVSVAKMGNHSIKEGKARTKIEHKGAKSSWDNIDEAEIPVDWDDECAAQQMSSKRKLSFADEDEEEEVRNGKDAKPPLKKVRGRPRKSITLVGHDDQVEVRESGEELVKTPLKRGRGRPRKCRTPARTDTIEGDGEDAEPSEMDVHADMVSATKDLDAVLDEKKCRKAVIGEPAMDEINAGVDEFQLN